MTHRNLTEDGDALTCDIVDLAVGVPTSVRQHAEDPNNADIAVNVVDGVRSLQIELKLSSEVDSVARMRLAIDHGSRTQKAEWRSDLELGV